MYRRAHRCTTTPQQCSYLVWSATPNIVDFSPLSLQLYENLRHLVFEQHNFADMKSPVIAARIRSVATIKLMATSLNLLSYEVQPHLALEELPVLPARACLSLTRCFERQLGLPFTSSSIIVLAVSTIVTQWYIVIVWIAWPGNARSSHTLVALPVIVLGVCMLLPHSFVPLNWASQF